HHHSPFPPPPHRLSALNPTPTPTFSPLSLHDSLPISKAARLRRTASAVAQLDVLTAFAKLAADRGYACPEFNSTGELLIVGGRHPVIEELLRQRGERFVPNDLCFEPGRQQLLLITGPNMGGKSTYLRQAALIILMAQMGS